MATRKDSYVNVLTGLGLVGRDKRMAGHAQGRRISREYAELLWESDDIAARIVELVPSEMTRNGFTLTIKDGENEPDVTAGEIDPSDDDTDPTALKDAPPANVKTDAFPPKAGAPAGAPSPMSMVPPPPPKPPGPINIKGLKGKAQADDAEVKYVELGGPEKFLEALCWERAFGGGAIFVGADDGATDLTQPLDEENIESIRWLNTLTPRECQVMRYYSDVRAPKYGQPMIYRITSDMSGAGGDVGGVGAPTLNPGEKPTTTMMVDVHESRLIVFPGPAVTRQRRLRNLGWGTSVFTRVEDVIRDFQMSYAGAASLVADFAQAIIKVKGLAKMMMSGGENLIKQRGAMLDIGRSNANALILDSEEDFERKSTAVTGLPDLLDRFAIRLAAAVDIPVTKLMGMAPAGLNATGDADVRNFYDRISADQERHLSPRLERLFTLIFLAKDGPTDGVEPDDWCIEHRPLWQMTEREQADLRLVQAQVDKLYVVDMAALTPEEVVASRFGGAQYSTETTIDIEGRQKMSEEHDAATEEHETAKAAAFTQMAKATPPAPAAPKPPVK